MKKVVMKKVVMKKVELSLQTKKGLERLGAVIVYFFGSRVQGGYLKYSDYDIGVVFNKKIQNGVSIYSKVYDLISQDVPDLINGPKLDISFLQKANPALQMTAVKYGKILLETDPLFRANYEERVTKLYNDYLPLKREFEEATIAAFND